MNISICPIKRKSIVQIIESIHFNNTFRRNSIDLGNNKFTVLNSSFFSHYKYMNLTNLKMNGTYIFDAEIQ
jgi:hypothetical protein